MKKKTEEKIVVRAKLNRSLPAENLHFTSLCYSPASTWPYLIIYLKNGNGILPTHTSLKMKKDRMKESSCNCNSCSCMSEYRCWLLHELASLRNGCCMHWCACMQWLGDNGWMRDTCSNTLNATQCSHHLCSVFKSH